MCAPLSNFDINKMSIESCEKTWKDLKCTSLSERNQSERATYWTIPTTCHFIKGKTMATVKMSGFGGGGGKDEEAEHGGS